MSQPDYDDEPARDASGERHRMLGNSFMLSANAGRFALTLPFVSGNWQMAISQSVQLCAWQTGDGEPQELELLVYPMHSSEGSGVPDDVNIQEYTQLILTRGVNAHRGRAGGVSYDTFLALPMNGLRMRFAAVSAVLKLMNVGPGTLKVTVNAGIYPVAGSNRDEEVALEPRNLTPIPKGARAYRTVPGASEGNAYNVGFYDFAGALLTSIQANTVTAWQPIPRGAYWVSTGGTSLYPGTGSKAPYFSSIFFQ